MIMTDDKIKPELGETTGNQVMQIVGSIPGAVPYIGPIIQAIISEVIPNIRIERIETYLRYLQDRIDELQLNSALDTLEGLDTFEEGMWQSARAFSEKRQKNIAELVSHGLKGEGEKQQQIRHFLRILNQLGDEDIALLMSHQNRETHQFEEGLNLSREHLLASFGLLAVGISDLGTIGSPARQEGAREAFLITEIGREFLGYIWE